MASYTLKANKWKKVGQWYGTMSKKLKVTVGTTRKCYWRRKTAYATTGSGGFYGSKTVTLFNSWLDVKSPVNTSATSKFVS